MNKALQNLALFGYRCVRASGLLALPPIQRAFEAGYFFYKTKFEASDIHNLKQYVRPGTSVIDVGANIGFFSVHFANWVSGNGKVIAIEPEEQNFIRLRERLKNRVEAGVVHLVQGVAAELEGNLRLSLNPDHPADHRIAEQGISVAAFTLDGLVAAHHGPEISLVKIDVQGAEMRVLQGANKLLRECRPILYIEVDDKALLGAGTSAEMLVSHLAEMGYEMYDPDYSVIRPIDPQLASKRRAAQGYDDYIFKPAVTPS
jgi:FkbM family methyltransferase